MRCDITEFERGCHLSADVCVIGAGIAGIAVTRQLMNSGRRVILLESGGTDYDPAIQELAAGESVGLPYYPLAETRLRFFGGTSAIWGGRIAEMNEIDFEPRPWVEHSGWPISRRELHRWYAEARRMLGVEPADADERFWPLIGAVAPAFDPYFVRTAFWQFDPLPGRFSLTRCRDLVTSPEVTVITRATATHIQARHDLGVIEHVSIGDPAGHRAFIRAKHFVLAAGGLENARLLLASNDVYPSGLGNEHDLVGRFFMEHPHARGGRIHTEQPWRLLRLYTLQHRVAGETVAACLRPGDGLQRRAGILNTAFSLGCRPHSGRQPFIGNRAYRLAKHRLQPTRSNRWLWQTGKRSILGLSRLTDPLRPWLLTQSGRCGLYAILRAEQAPNPRSRVYLSGERDALGVPRLVLDWQLQDIDKRSVRVAMQAFDSELRRLGLGHVELAPWLEDPDLPWQFDPSISNHPVGGYHHMGTTRMADRPSRGVVDRKGRVFGLANLYVAGSSVFATGGWANPTLTLAALSLRLGEHLRQVERRARVPELSTATNEPTREAMLGAS